jgi:hypothetical protein
MKLTDSHISISPLLDLMEKNPPLSINLNHLVIDDGMTDSAFGVELERLPAFSLEYPGFVEVEIHMDPTSKRVVRLRLMQSAMTFEELTANGDTLPNLTVNCDYIPVDERARLNTLAQDFIVKGKVKDVSTFDSLLSQYVSKSLFCPRKYGGTTHEC